MGMKRVFVDRDHRATLENTVPATRSPALPAPIFIPIVARARAPQQARKWARFSRVARVFRESRLMRRRLTRRDENGWKTRRDFAKGQIRAMHEDSPKGGEFRAWHGFAADHASGFSRVARRRALVLARAVPSRMQFASVVESVHKLRSIPGERADRPCELAAGADGQRKSHDAARDRQISRECGNCCKKQRNTN